MILLCILFVLREDCAWGAGSLSLAIPPPDSTRVEDPSGADLLHSADGASVCLRCTPLPTPICREPSAGKSSCSHYRAWRWPYGPPLFNGRYYWLAIMNLPRIGQYRSSHPECAAGNPCCQRHPAIAAGRHSKLSDSPYAFLRQHYTLLRRLPGFGWLLRGVG